MRAWISCSSLIVIFNLLSPCAYICSSAVTRTCLEDMSNEMDKAEKLELVKNAVRSYPDFPQKGIIFRDIFGVFQNVAALRALKDLVIEHVMFLDIDLIVGLDSRGFLFGPMISIELGKPFLPIRKKGKLPGKVIQKRFTLEYGEAVFEVQTDYIKPGVKVLIVDDLLATGGSMSAAIKLLQSAGAEVVECLVILELTNLKGREKFNIPTHSIIQYS